MHEAADNLLGWTTDSLVQLDPLAPGLISRVLTASSKSRQAIFTVLASRLLIAEHNDAFGRIDDGDDANLAFVLREGRAREILELTFGRVPDGWLGALERLGGKPMSSLRSYMRLHAIFADREHRAKAEALRHVGQIDEKMLLVLDALDERWVHAETLKRLATTVSARDFNRSIAFAQSVSSKATDEAVAAAISRLAPTVPLKNVVSRFVRRADRFPPHPLIGDEEIRPLASVRDYIECGRRYRNCIGTMLDEVLVGQVAFAEFRHECIIEFRPLSLGRGWLFKAVYVSGNGLVSSELSLAAKAKCEALSIPSVEQSHSGEDWRRYRRFVRGGGWEERGA